MSSLPPDFDAWKCTDPSDRPISFAKALRAECRESARVAALGLATCAGCTNSYLRRALNADGLCGGCRS